MAYTFHQPIRYYKANDPYYYEVDNIPLRQLEENILFIKNKLEGPTGEGGNVYLTENSEISINQIKELRPKLSGGRTIRVNAGRFTSRINDAYNITDTLATLVYDSLSPGGNEPILIPDLKNTWTEAMRDEVWNAFTETVGSGGKPYNINGLEYTFTFQNSPGGLGGNWGTIGGSENYPHYNSPTQQVRWPGFNTFGPLTASLLGPVIGYDLQYTFETLPNIHQAFVRKWRGVFRTAVVDFPTQTIDIPAFGDWDYYYKTAAGADIPIPNATQRIDLLVAYSVPIDASSTTLQDYESGFCDTGSTPTPKTITYSQLGLVRGAGVGIRQRNEGVVPQIATEEGCDDLGTAGSPRILGNIHDSDILANTGITDRSGNKIHGSFPSPDDLLNMAPLLALDVEDNDFQLIGQAALPIAYIVVNQGQTNLSWDNIIDIRPFLRTTEFTYNERAGVAGANPPLSLANPAVGLFQLQDVAKKIYSNLYDHLPGEDSAKSGRVIYTDYVMGGLAYGPEGTLLSMNPHNTNSKDPWGTETTTASLTYDGTSYTFTQFVSNKAFLEEATLANKEALLQYFYNNRQPDLKVWLSDPNSSYNLANGTYLGLPAGDIGRNIPLYPEWDQPFSNATQLASVMTGTQKSAKVTWWMWIEGWGTRRPLAYVPGGVTSTRAVAQSDLSFLDVDYNPGWGNTAVNGMIVTSSKRIEVILPEWAQDYDVMIEYVNCGPITSTTSRDTVNSSDGRGLGSGLYVNKGPVVDTGTRRAVFYINSASQPLPESGAGALCNGRITDAEATNNSELCNDSTNRNSAPGPNAAYDWLSYSVCVPQFRATGWGMNQQKGEVFANNTRYAPKFGMCFYPTVKFSVIAYKDSTFESNTLYSPNNNYTLIETAGDSSAILSPTAPLYQPTVIDLQGALGGDQGITNR